MMIEADVLLRGQGTSQQQLVPIMAHPPATDSDLTFSEWLNTTKSTGKGLKLDFKCIEAVELCLQDLKKHHKQIKGPVWLNADILPGPGFTADHKVVDAKRFLRLCTTMFPESTLSLGWKTGSNPTEKYSWSMVKEMYNLIKEWDVKQPITFPIRASLLPHSVPQIKWLTEMTTASLSLWMASDDQVTLSHMAYIRHKFSQGEIFYDLTDEFMKEFKEIKEDTESHVASEFKHADSLSFKPTHWDIVKSIGEKVIHMGSESVLMKNGVVISKNEYKSSSFNPVKIKGQAELLDVADKLDSKVGFEIYLRVDKSTSSSNISGVKCFIGANGKLNIASSNIEGVNTFGQAMLKVKPGCIQYTIIDAGDKITLSVEIYGNCLNVDNDVLARESVSLSTHEIKSKNYHIALKTSVANVHVAIPQFNVEM